MAQFTNTQILAAVLTSWARPAITQIMASRINTVPALASVSNFLKTYGIVSQSYNIGNDLLPFLQNGLDTIVQPFLEKYLEKVPDAAIPEMAHSFAKTASMQPKFSILGGIVEFEQDDILELIDLLEKNLPLQTVEKYKIVK